MRPQLDGLPSSTFQRVLCTVRRLARDRHAPILLEGEPGTGKTTIARVIHDESPRATGPFQTLLVSAVDDALCGSELFGHTVGAFTDARAARTGQFASAHGGTLFLDEIGKASLHVQQRLLRAIETGEIRPIGSDRDMRVDVRVVAASNRSLGELAEQGTFLPDLHARLEVFRVELPPLRSRRADIPALAEGYLAFHAVRGGRAEVPELDAALAHALQAAPWPNNLRQLSATMHRLLIECDGASTVGLDHCRDDLAYLAEGHRDRVPFTDEIQAALAETGSISRAARKLGVHRTTVHRHLRAQAAAAGSAAVPA